MTDEVFQFHWPKSDVGYSWSRARPIGETADAEAFLLDARGVGVTRTTASYPLRDAPGLFKEFAETPPIKEDIRLFANAHGQLGVEVVVVSEEEGSGPVYGGERLRDWVREIKRMKEAVAVWEMAKKGDAAGLAKVIRWSPDGRTVGFQSARRSQLIASEKFRPDFMARLRPGDLVKPAFFFVLLTINDALAEDGRVIPRLLWGDKDERLALRVVPRNLIGALWLQFALAVDGDKKYQRCAHCGTWIDMSPPARSTKQYCSGRCRLRAYVERKSREN